MNEFGKQYGRPRYVPFCAGPRRRPPSRGGLTAERVALLEECCGHFQRAMEFCDEWAAVIGRWSAVNRRLRAYVLEAGRRKWF